MEMRAFPLRAGEQPLMQAGCVVKVNDALEQRPAESQREKLESEGPGGLCGQAQINRRDYDQ